MSKKQRWASDDDANDLLAGILDETENDAKAEEQRIQAEIQAREAEERRKREAEEERKRREAEARISAEMERQNTVQERRTARMEAMKIEDLKAKGEWIDPAVVARQQAEAEEKRRREEEAEIRRKAMEQAAMQAAQAQHALPAQAQAAPANNNKLFASIGAVAALVLVSGGVLLAMAGGYEVDKTPYTKTVFKPKDVAIALVEKGSTPIPKVEEAPVEEETKTVRRSSSPRKATASVSKATAKPAAKEDKVGKAANKKASALEDMLKSSGSDPFGL